jgi:excisionase family DNA binding protein
MRNRYSLENDSMSVKSSQILTPFDTRIALRIDDASSASGLGRSSIYDLIARGKLAPTKIGGRRLILRESLENLLRAGEGQP